MANDAHHKANCNHLFHLLLDSAKAASYTMALRINLRWVRDGFEMVSRSS